MLVPWSPAELREDLPGRKSPQGRTDMAIGPLNRLCGREGHAPALQLGKAVWCPTSRLLGMAQAWQASVSATCLCS